MESFHNYNNTLGFFSSRYSHLHMIDIDDETDDAAMEEKAAQEVCTC